MFNANPAVQRLNNDRVSGAITIDGVIHRTGFLLVITGLCFWATWQGTQAGSVPEGVGILGIIIGLVLGLVISLTRTANPILIASYAAAEGVGLGAISYFVNRAYPGIAATAVTCTMGVFLSTLVLYRLRILRATPTFVKVLTGAILGVAVLYLVNIIAGLFGHPLEIVVGHSMASIALSGVIVIIAALSFVIDFNEIELAVENGADASYAWRCSFSLLVGLVWLYVEILRLLIKLRGRD